MMKHTLPILFVTTAFAATSVTADYSTANNDADTFFPKVRVSEHSLGYNFPGSEYEIVQHADLDAETPMVSNEVAQIEDASSFFPKVRVDEHSLGYNYPGSKYELLTHGDLEAEGSSADY